MKLSVTINKCQVRYLEMLGTYPIAGIHETVSYCQQMSGTIPRNVRYISSISCFRSENISYIRTDK